MDNKNAEINILKKKLEDLKKRWPAHSLKPAMMEELEELEERLEKLIKEKEKADHV